MSFLDEPLLLVPMHVDALAVGTTLPDTEMFQWTNLAPNFSKLRSGYQFGSELVGDSEDTGNPFDEADGLDPGIHLHFRLPRAFSHGSQQGAGELVFPAIPNRWLVQRICQAPDNKLTHKAWLIKSDALAPDDSSGVPWPTFPKDTETPVKFESIGSCTELTAPLGEGAEPARVNLTVIGQGNPLFSAHYPACRGVLGFHDSMTDVSDGSRLSYLVTGWFSAATDDPLHGAAWKKSKPPADEESNFRAKHKIPAAEPLTPEQHLNVLWDAWFRARQWTCDFDPNVEPGRLLCHGLVRGITWQGEAWNYLQPDGKGASVSGPEVFPPNTDNYEKAYQVAVGNTGVEALAALHATGDVDQDLLAALQGGLLSQPVTAADLQYELHGRRFDGVQGGTTFGIQPAGDHSQVNGTGASNPATRRKSTVIPVPLRDFLQKLNRAQTRCDRLAREVEDCRWQVYALWYLLTTERKKATDRTRVKMLRLQLTTFKEVLKKEKTDLDAARTVRDTLYTARKDPEASTGTIIKELAKYPKTQPDGSPMLNDAGYPELKYRLVPSTAPPFYKPAEPVIAVRGPAMARRNSWEQSTPLACRFSEQVVTGIKLQPSNNAARDVTGIWLLGTMFPEKAALRFLDATHKSLLGEALLLDEQHASKIAGELGEHELVRLTPIVRALQDPTSTAAQSNKPPEAPNALIGRLPDRIATFAWQRSPWIPLLLVWEVSWQSSYDCLTGQELPENLLTSRWNLDKNGDLAAGNSSVGTKEATYQGYSILTPSASTHLAKCLAALDKSHPLINILKNQNAQLQRLDGFNHALTLQKPGMQIPPLDFTKYSKEKSYLLDQIHADLNDGFAPAEQRDRFRTVPDTLGNPFLPIRAGQLKITHLSIVDAFGQTLKLPVEQINESAGKKDTMLRRAHSCALGASKSAMTLRPRFAQPMRLRFEGVNASAGQQANGGPVCGWILPNHLEKSLTIYAANGKPLGALQRKLGQRAGTGDKGAFYWVEVPGGSYLFSVSLDYVSELNALRLPDTLRKQFNEKGYVLPASKKCDLRENEWTIGGDDIQYRIRKEGNTLNVYAERGVTDVPQRRKLGDRLETIIENKHLCHFCTWALSLSPDMGGVFATLLSEAIASADQRVPDEDPGVSVLVGRALALVRASLQFEAAGMPAHRPELRADTGTSVPDLIETNGFENVKWPLRLGDLAARNDGLIGAFRCSPAASGEEIITSGPFYPAWGQDQGDAVKGPEVTGRNFARQDFSIDCAQPLQVTLLTDPQARVHATTGALPRASFELPPETATGARRAREVFFQTAPVLGFSPTPGMPRPSDDYGEWSWAYRPDVTQWKLDPNLVEAGDRAGFINAWPTINEGWLKLAIASVKVLSFWVRERTEEVTAGTNLHLAWSLQGAESLELLTVNSMDGRDVVESVERWDAPPFPSEYPVKVVVETTYRLVASTEDAKDDAKDLTIKIAVPKH